MSEWTIERTAEVLLEAGRNRADHGPITEERPGPDLATAYRAQHAPLTSEMTGAMPLQLGSSVTLRFSGLGSVSVAGV
jgi:2-keto-4-pentenoate hydratase